MKDNSMDAVVGTLVLCSVPDMDAALKGGFLIGVFLRVPWHLFYTVSNNCRGEKGAEARWDLHLHRACRGSR